MLSLIPEQAALEGRDWDTYEKLIAKLLGWDPKSISSVTYEYAEIFGTNGGSVGSQVMKVKTVTGRSSEKEISHHAMAAVSAGIEFSSVLSPVSAHAEVSSQYDFTSARTDAMHKEEIHENTLTIDFSKPSYVYQKTITINYVDGTKDTIGTGMFFSNEPMSLTETIPYCKMNI